MLANKLLYSQTDDLDLFLLVKKGDMAAFEEIYKRSWPALINAAYKRLNSRQKAEEIVQEMFIDLYKKRMGIELNISVQAYLFDTLKFKILNVYRMEMNTTKNKKVFFSRN